MALIGIWDNSLHIRMIHLFNMFLKCKIKLKYWLFIDCYNIKDLFDAKPVDFRSF